MTTKISTFFTKRPVHRTPLITLPHQVNAGVWTWMLLAAIGVVLTAGVWRFVQVDDYGDNIMYQLDADIYRLGALRYFAGEELYNVRLPAQGINLPFIYPPFAAVLFYPLTFVSANYAGLVLNSVTILALIVTMAVVLKHFGARYPWLFSLALLPIALSSEPVIETLRLGQINVLVMALIIIDVWGRPRWLPEGVLTGIAVAIKVTPGIFVIYWLVKQDWKAIAGMAGGFLAATLVGLIGGIDYTITYFTSAMFTVGDYVSTEFAKNVSLNGVMLRLQLPHWMWAIACVLVLVGAVLACRRLVSLHRDGLAVSVLAIAGLLVSPISWSHHWVFLVPVALCLYAAEAPFLWLWTVLLTLIFDFQSLVHSGDDAWRWWPWFDLAMDGSYTIFGVVFIVVMLFFPPVDLYDVPPKIMQPQTAV